MDYIDKIRYLRIINDFNFSGPYLEDKEKNADLVIAKFLHDFNQNFKTKILQGYTFVIMNDDNLYSVLACRLIKSAIAINTKTIKLRYCGENNELFRGIKPIKFEKVEKLKKVVLITGYHPIYNVAANKEYSKNFVNICSPLETFTPQALEVLFNFYLGEENKDIKFCHSSEQQRLWYNFFTYPIKEIEENDIFIRKHLSILRTNPKPVAVFELTGTEEDFNLYDFILDSSKEGNIHLYYIPEDKINFVKTNLSPFLDYRNQVMELNLLNKEELEQIKKIKGQNIYVFNNLTFPKEE